ncbi:MAG: hypothetical protein CO186_09940 [Zetaproteobacteria bacterium CG_4_9_14_3_um_filter_49_83]|nr:MAG: hypothetical protein AUJ56_07215 [Zetaproteobacteria bacterium CG1_02_49_23]PIQ34557.1 MAG: hypothetical protein COW62_01230 [Zetaproteobacteria bacterium CG17_big_fil_post_rev_8_21_14_2_50_50_13]PIV29412.1 MAG: hypothetical protein COS35_12165 [Zetaproteobacteria bacterium CG02_land_8_20_14_3_00_50_9]PIY56572.1 MAG: hypothetical protein COZ00_03480 [Zetaproteobacteria bacterium CG_4_10_14_0_8_um_filter_49_80]PJA34613.1 MAG: hypothetical protein CO186_09940 [Zetaproteobacteria bacterium
MYKDWFELNDAPFSISPNPAYLYMSQQHQEALAHLMFGMNHDGGIILLTGEVGTGKTTISRKLLEQIPEQLPDKVDLAWIVNPKLSAYELLATLCDELGIENESEQTSIKTLTDRISAYLLQAHAKGRNTVLMIDEAQNLMPDVLEQLRLLTNLETNERKLLQIVLIGQPELQEMLSRHDLRQFSQRITARFHLEALKIKETREYIQHRLNIAGSQQRIFTASAIRLAHRISGGIPRRINLICDRAMLGAYAKGQHRVTPAQIKQAAKETLGQNEQRSMLPWLLPATVTMAAIIAIPIFFSDFKPAAETIQHIMPTKNSLPEMSKQAASPPITEQPSATAVAEIQQSSQPATSVTTSESTPMLASADSEEIPPVLEEVAISPPEEADPWAEIALLGSKDFAFQTLAEQWNLDMPFADDPCKWLEKHHLQCLRQRAGMAQLRDLNRPAIIPLMANGEKIMAVLTAMNDEQVTLQIKDASWSISLDEFEQHWFADFTLVWRSPEGFQHAIRPGNKGQVVQWLARQLDTLQGTMIPPREYNSMNLILVERLKDFQRQVGLKPDGSAGPQTLIRLNDALHLEGPRLSSPQTEPTT